MGGNKGEPDIWSQTSLSLDYLFAGGVLALGIRFWARDKLWGRIDMGSNRGLERFVSSSDWVYYLLLFWEFIHSPSYLFHCIYYITACWSYLIAALSSKLAHVLLNKCYLLSNISLAAVFDFPQFLHGDGLQMTGLSAPRFPVLKIL